MPDDELTRGLFSTPKSIQGKFLWDEAGSLLFERVCAAPGYYPSGREFALLSRAADAVAQTAGAGATLVEFGCAGSDKASLLLDAMRAPACYVGIDISGAAAAAVTRAVAQRHAPIATVTLCADYSQPITLPRPPGEGRTIGFFPGIAVGNFDPDDAGRFLSRARDTLGPQSLLLVAIDSTVDPDLLRAAYSDDAGRMAAFHLNVLRRLQRETGLDLPPDAFRHEICISHQPTRVEAHLVAQRDLSQRLDDGRTVSLARGDSILTDISHKHEPDDFHRLAARSGWTARTGWSDDRTRISLQLLTS